jgi:hypothetical protein
MIERVENIIIPKIRLTSKSEDNDTDLANFKCRRMMETYIKDYLPESTSLIIMWTDKNNMLSTAYCNVSPLKRLELYIVGWLQELFDFKVERNGKK